MGCVNICWYEGEINKCSVLVFFFCFFLFLSYPIQFSTLFYCPFFFLCLSFTPLFSILVAFFSLLYFYSPPPLLFFSLFFPCFSSSFLLYPSLFFSSYGRNMCWVCPGSWVKKWRREGTTSPQARDRWEREKKKEKERKRYVYIYRERDRIKERRDE